jgi:hypothetical protein
MSPFFILMLYNLFQRNNFFTRDLDWYKVLNLSHNALVVASPNTFSNNEYERQTYCSLRFTFQLFIVSDDILVGAVHGSTTIH